MFYYILQYYQKEIHNKNNTRSFKDLSVEEKAMIIILIISAIGFIVFVFLSKMIVSLAFVGIMLGDIFCIMRYTNSHWNKSSIDLMEEYEQEKIEILKQFLANSKVNMYNKKSIEWLVQMCSKELEKQDSGKFFDPIKTFFTVIIYPILAATAAIIIKDMKPDDVLSLATLVVGLLCEIFAIIYMIYPTLEEFLNKNKKLLEAFQTDLEFILLKF